MRRILAALIMLGLALLRGIIRHQGLAGDDLDQAVAGLLKEKRGPKNKGK